MSAENAGHLRAAERLLAQAELPNSHPDANNRLHYVRLAHVHALLALVPDQVYLDVARADQK